MIYYIYSSIVSKELVMENKIQVGQEVEIKGKKYLVKYVGKRFPNGLLLGVSLLRGERFYGVFTDGNGGFSTLTKIG